MEGGEQKQFQAGFIQGVISSPNYFYYSNLLKDVVQDRKDLLVENALDNL